MVTRKKVVKKSSTKKRTVKKSSVRKSAATKTTSKKRTVKKSSVKKSTAKKTTSKKRAVQKRVIKKSSVKKNNTKKKSAARNSKLNIGDRYNIPEVPALSTKFDSRSKLPSSSKNQNEFFSSIEIQGSKKNSPKIFVFLLLVAVSIGAAYSLSNKSEVVSSDTNQGTSSEPSSSPTPTNSKTSSPAIKVNTSSPNSESFSLKYLYNSTGISISLIGAANLGDIKSFELKVKYNNVEQIDLGTYSGTISAVQVTKSDTVGNSVFTAIATLSNGSKITSDPLTIRGKFEKS